MATHPAKPADDQANIGDVATAKSQAIEGGRKAAEQVSAAAEGAARAGLHTASEAIDRSTDAARQGIKGMTAQSELAFRRSQQNLEAVADAGGVMIQAAQEISTAWMNLAQARAQRMAQGLRILATCRTPADFLKAQSELLQSGLEQVIDTNRRVADVSMRTMQDVATKIQRPYAV